MYLFARWIVSDDSTFEKIIGGLAVPGNFAGMAGVTLVKNGSVNSCHPQSAAPSRRNFRWWVDLLDHQRCDERASTNY